MLAQMQCLDDQTAVRGQSPDVPRTGRDLRHIMHVLLKTSDEDKRDILKHLVH